MAWVIITSAEVLQGDLEKFLPLSSLEGSNLIPMQ
jgi:hypothetical protein